MAQDTDITYVVTSKIKKHVKETYGLRTSTEAIDALSTMVVEAIAVGVKNAASDNRKTLQARDFDVDSSHEDTAPAAVESEPESSDSVSPDLSSFGL